MPGSPGKGGRTPKRDSQRRRSNSPKPDKALTDDVVRGPALEGEHCPQAVRWWEALRRSGQAQFFEPSDWATAELVVEAYDSFVEKPSASLLSSMGTLMSGLLATEGDRRRLRLELERDEDDLPADSPVTLLDEYRTG